MIRRLVIVVIIGLTLLLTACVQSLRPGIITIDRVDLVVMESNPPRVQAHIVGHLGDGCTTLASITQHRDGNTITITVKAIHSGAEVCAAIAPVFDQRVMIEGTFTPGEYTVIVNGVAHPLTIS
ncbi:MAG: hypothetical protein C0184_14725 [Chloroflexus aggregans]|uniref:Uncharacterized protein n=1 Tax=Chloroflexus aggregans TaxID=152260 RepID=A0A2J6WV92_9CHLR|nr:MAG: hypothetical protein C0184_14725 [Chloroflexus aggregans]